MMKRKLSTEQLVLLFLFITAAASVVFMSQLVAPPKILMGRMLTAISPSLFPSIMLSALALLSGLLLALSFAEASEHNLGGDYDLPAIKRGVLLFAWMLLYALTMTPFGFLISSFIAIVLISLLAGNRSALQVGCIAVVGPIALYLTATRVLAVSLPELNVIELFYAQQLGL